MNASAATHRAHLTEPSWLVAAVERDRNALIAKARLLRERWGNRWSSLVASRCYAGRKVYVLYIRHR